MLYFYPKKEAITKKEIKKTLPHNLPIIKEKVKKKPVVKKPKKIIVSKEEVEYIVSFLNYKHKKPNLYFLHSRYNKLRLKDINLSIKKWLNFKKYDLKNDLSKYLNNIDYEKGVLFYKVKVFNNKQSKSIFELGVKPDGLELNKDLQFYLKVKYLIPNKGVKE